MRLEVEFDAELWRIKFWWQRRLCAWFGHPGFEAAPRRGFTSVFFGDDPRERCTRCNAPDPAAPEPEPYVHSFVPFQWGGTE